MHVMLTESPNVADWISAIGQAVGALATAAAVVVALYIAGRDSRQRKFEERNGALAQARLIRVSAPEVDGSDLIFSLNNYSDSPITLVAFEAFAEIDGEDERFRASEEIWLPDRSDSTTPKVRLSLKSLTKLYWRVRWTDPGGRMWFVDQDFGQVREFPARVSNTRQLELAASTIKHWAEHAANRYPLPPKERRRKP